MTLLQEYNKTRVYKNRKKAKTTKIFADTKKKLLFSYRTNLAVLRAAVLIAFYEAASLQFSFLLRCK
jgi:hypothetical protein